MPGVEGRQGEGNGITGGEEGQSISLLGTPIARGCPGLGCKDINVLLSSISLSEFLPQHCLEYFKFSTQKQAEENNGLLCVLIGARKTEL